KVENDYSVAISNDVATTKLLSSVTTGADGTAIATAVTYDVTNAAPFIPLSVSRDGVTREASIPHRGRDTVTREDEDVTQRTAVDDNGLVNEFATLDGSGTITASTRS
ncbi:MAG: hypothetical protein ACSLFQ_22050, partial [Thermoanaerobaculia bacterium]